MGSSVPLYMGTVLVYKEERRLHSRGSNQQTGTLEKKKRVTFAVGVHSKVLAATDLDVQVEYGLFSWLGPYQSCHMNRWWLRTGRGEKFDLS